MAYRIDQADVLDWHNEGLYHAMLCDPPYELTSARVRELGHPSWNEGTKRLRSQKGFMGKEWDGTGVAFQPETWAHLAQFLHPGAFIMAFGGSRTHHRLACAIEDAGFIVHPSIVWVYGSGFPKATRIDTQIDKGDAREEKLEREYRFTKWMRSTGISSREIDEATDSNMGGHYLTDKSQPAIPTADMFDKLRPFLPKPPQWVEGYVKQRTIESKQFAEREVVGKGEAGAGKGRPLHDGGFQADYNITAPSTPLAQAWESHRYGLQALKPAAEMIVVAQKPYAGKPVDCITGTGAGALNIDGGRVGTDALINQPAGTLGNELTMDGGKAQKGRRAIAVSGRWPANFILGHSPECDGDCAPDCPVRRLGEQSGEKMHGAGTATDGSHWEHPFGEYQASSYHMGQSRRPHRFGDSGTAARFFFQADWNLEQADPFFYQAKAARKERDAGLEGHCVHPTLKPIALTQYLATLLLPPAEYAPRRILVPFAGSGSECIGAHLAGWDEVVGIEKEPEYVKIAEARLAHWTMQPMLV